MRVGILDGRGVAVVERPEPNARGDIVKVRVDVIPMCTEFKDRRAGAVSDFLGHEAAGVVVDAGESTRVAVGDRVVVMPRNACGVCALCLAGEHIHCRNQRDVLQETGSSTGTATYAEFLIKPDHLLIKVPDGVSLDHASLACCGLGPGFNAVKRIRVGDDDVVVVSGCGPVGLGAIVNAVHRGARVIALEPNARRAELALKVGADVVVDPLHPRAVDQVREASSGGRVTCGIETAGLPTSAAFVLSLMEPRGRLALLAWDVPLRLPPIVPLGAEVHGCWHWNHLIDEAEMWSVIAQSAPALDAMVTHEFALADVAEAMDLQDSGACGKVLMHTDRAEES